ncbi:unnamed protein product [Sphacelaria rigidula]
MSLNALPSLFGPQEYLVVKVFNRELGLFLTLLQFFGYATYACLRRCLHKEKERKIPLSYYFFLGLLQACMQGLTNVSMMFLHYPAKVLFKSSRMVPIMCFGVLWQGRKYAWTDYVVVFLIVTGLITFMNADTRAQDSYAGDSTSLIGVALISMALVIDAALINIQEEIMNKYDSCQDELIMFSYLSGTVFIALACLYTGDLTEGARFVYDQGIGCILAVMLFAGAGFMGVSCVAALTKRFGALASAITTTARKAGTLLLSFVLFPKPVSPQHYFGAGLFIVGLVIKSTGKRSKSGDKQLSSGGGSGRTGKAAQENSPAATPIAYYDTGRKRLLAVKEPDQFEVSVEAPLLSDSGNGGASSNADNSGTGGAPDPVPNRTEGQVAVPGNSGGHPARHRGSTQNGRSPRMNGANFPGNGGVGVNGYRRARHSPSLDNTSFALADGLGSPTRRRYHRPIGSPPVTGLGFRS